MNYYNPYYSAFPYTSVAPKLGLFSRIFGKNFNFATILSGTQKTLNIVNQTIPIVKQATPVFKNAKTMFKVMSEFKKVDTPPSTNKTVTNIKKETAENNLVIEKTSGPTFFA